MRRLRCLGLLCGLILMLAGTVWGDWNPIGFQKWQDSGVDSLFRQRVGGQFASYPNISGADTTWEAIDNDWTISGDTLAYNYTDILKVGVKLDGSSTVKVTWGGTEYTVTQKLKKLIWLKTDTWNWIDVVDSAIWTVPSVDSNIISWTNVFPGVNYKIQKRNASVAHAIVFKKAFLDSAVTLYNQRPDSLDIALGNVVEYDLINVDNPDSTMDVGRRKLKQLGKYVFELREQTAHFPRSDTMPTIRVRQRWLKQAGKLYCVEYLMMSQIKEIHVAYPNAVIWHNDVKQISGTTNIDDAQIGGGPNSNKNYGGSTYGNVSSLYNFLIRVKNLASELGAGATISAAICSLYCSVNTTDDDIDARRIFKPWVEGDEDGVNDNDGDVTFNDWVSDDYEWGTFGALCANDDGVDNNQDGTCNASGRDRKVTYESTANVTTVNTWYGWSVTAALAQDWYDGDANENGVHLKYRSGSNQFYTTEYGSGNNPFWTFTYTGAAPAVGNSRRNWYLRPRLRGETDEEDMDFRCRLDPADYRQ